MEPSIEKRQRILKSVAGALNIVLPDDTLRSIGGRSRGAGGKGVRYVPQQQLLIVVEGRLESNDDLSVAARQLVDVALGEISGPARRDCRAALVAWVARDGSSPAAAFDLTTAGGPTIVGASWQPRHLWLRPMPDPNQPPKTSLEEAIKLVSVEVQR